MSGATIPYCGPGALPTTLMADWNGDPVLLSALFLFAGAWTAIRKRTGAAPGAVSGKPDAAFAGAWVVLLIAFVSPLCALSAALFAARVTHHLLLVTVAAPLLALAWHGLPAAKVRAPLPLVPTALAHVVVFWVWHAPVAYAAALSDDTLYWTMELSLLVTAVLFWCAALDRRRHIALVIPALIGVMAQMGLLAALFVFGSAALYEPHETTTWTWGLTPLEDQQLAGLIMWVPGAVPYLAALVAMVAGSLAEGDGKPRAE